LKVQFNVVGASDGVEIEKSEILVDFAFSMIVSRDMTSQDIAKLFEFYTKSD
jgi:hypothetical protein